MVTIPELQLRLQEQGIRVWVESGNLRYSAPKGALAGNLREQVASRKEELVAYLLKQETDSSASSDRIPIVDRGGRLPVSFSQEQLWIIDQLEGPSPTYNMHEAVRVSGPLEIEALEQSFNDVIGRHEVLRTALYAGEDDEIPELKIEKDLAVGVSMTDFEDYPSSERETIALQKAEEWIREPFDLRTPPLIRIKLGKIGPTDHILVVVLHHIIADGWSLGIFWKEWSVAYNCRIRGESPELPPQTLQFPDYASWEREQLGNGIWDSYLEEWKNLLADAPSLLEIPADRPRPVKQSFRGARALGKLENSGVEILQNIGQKYGCSLFSVLLCAWKVILYRYSGQQDVVVGSPIAKRDRSELERMIGFLVNTLPFRTKLDGEHTLAQSLQAVGHGTLEVMEWSAVPFERLVREINPERSPSYHPVFQVGLALEHREGSNHYFDGIECDPIFLDMGSSRFDLMLWLTRTTSGLEVSLEYSTDLFENHTSKRLVDHFLRLLRCFNHELRSPISQIDFLSEAEHKCFLEDWNQGETKVEQEQHVGRLVELQAERIPDKTAVVFEKDKLTYNQLDRRANSLANLLINEGVAQGDLVGVYMERSIDMIAALLAVWKAGAAYVPLDPIFPVERIKMILEDATPRMLLVQRNLEVKSLSELSPVLVIDEIRSTSTQNPNRFGQGKDLAYVIFTSGSTGRPKGVEISHRALANFLLSMKAEPGMTESDVILALTTLSFDIAGLELWLPLIVGGKVIVASDHDAMVGEAIARLIEQHSVSILQATPVTFRLLIESGWGGSDRLKVLCGGEALPGDLAASLLPKCGELWNMYGPTETTIWSTCCRVEDARDIHIGRPIANTQVYVVNDSLKLQPVGVPGELLIGGDGLARGYLGRDELTAEKFVPNPFGPGRLYRTGDLAKWRDDGVLFCLGRTDHQVKVRGFRIELGEIEAALSEVPGVRQAVAALAGGDRLVAYYTSDSGEPFPAREAREALGRRLPGYMVPADYVHLEEIPLTPNGKVDRKALPEPGAGEPERSGEYAPPRNEVEEKLVKIWEDVLKRKPVGVNDNFFELGGHSLLAVQMQVRAVKDLGAKWELVDLFDNPTIRLLGHKLNDLGTNESSEEGVEIGLL